MMKANQLNKGHLKRVMYIENKDGFIDGANARIGWVSFSKTGRTVYYRGWSLLSIGQGFRGNFLDIDSREEYWISGVKKRGTNVHVYESISSLVVDDDAFEEYKRLRS